MQETKSVSNQFDSISLEYYTLNPCKLGKPKRGNKMKIKYLLVFLIMYLFIFIT